MRNVIALATIVIALMPHRAWPDTSVVPRQLSYTVAQTRSHPNLAFTQGLLIKDRAFFEASGLYHQSFVQHYPIDEPSVPATVKHLPKNDFAEGLALTDGYLWMLTWRQGIARRINPANLQQMDLVRYKGEGWGLTFDGKSLIMSDGSDTLQWRSPAAFELIKTQPINFAGKPLTAINELEFSRGLIWANVWFDKRIHVISPDSGNVIAFLDMADIIAQESQFHPGGLPQEAVLNGIAYDPETETFWITGKHWRRLYQLQIDLRPLALKPPF